MKFNKYKSLIIGFLAGSVFLSSCSKWIDIRPNDLVYAEDAFQERIGFESALSGIYSKMTDRSLYGVQLKFNYLDQLAGYWLAGNQPITSIYDYTSVSSRESSKSIWSSLYNVIHQSNIVLDNLHNIQGDEFYDIIKGEALGIRAFSHLELFKLFGPVVVQEGLANKCIPYYKSSKKKIEPFLTAEQVLENIELDLLEALDLLKNDPIQQNGRDANGNNSSLFDYNYLLNYRGARINIYAVKGMLASLYELKGEAAKALEFSENLIAELESNKAAGIRFLTSPEIVNNLIDKDIRFSRENIFSLLKNKSQTTNDGYFGQSQDLRPAMLGFLDVLYTQGSGNGNDYRLLNWLTTDERFVKFLNVNPEIQNLPFRNELKLISLPDIYFIAIEASLKTNPQRSLELLNKFRSTRNLGALTSTDPQVIYSDYIDEYRREQIGEGKLFTFYKRLFHEIFRANGNVQPSISLFKFPIPEDELIFNNSY